MLQLFADECPAAVNEIRQTGGRGIRYGWYIGWTQAFRQAAFDSSPQHRQCRWIPYFVSMLDSQGEFDKTLDILIKPNGAIIFVAIGVHLAKYEALPLYFTRNCCFIAPKLYEANDSIA